MSENEPANLTPIRAPRQYGDVDSSSTERALWLPEGHMLIDIYPLVFRMAEIIAERSGAPDAIALVRERAPSLRIRVRYELVERALFHTVLDLVPLETFMDIYLNMDDDIPDPERLADLLERVTTLMKAEAIHPDADIPIRQDPSLLHNAKRIITFVRFVQYLTDTAKTPITIQVAHMTRPTPPSCMRKDNTFYLNEAACLRWGQIIIQAEYLREVMAYLMNTDPRARMTAYTKLLERVTMETVTPSVERFREIIAACNAPPPALPPHIPKDKLN